MASVLPAGIIAINLLAWGLLDVQAAVAVDFNRDIRPLLSDRCFFCHGPDAEERKAGLRLDVEAEAKKSRKGVTAIIEGRPRESEIIARIRAADPDERMPPPHSGKALTAEEIELLEQWIADGAPWSQHWAYQTPVASPAPDTANPEWTRNWIDAWVLSKMEAEGLRPSNDADPATLVRRLSFDLCGMVPDPAMVESFVQKPDRLGYERLVDSLLGSPQFGERLASYWLDLVRYADTVGYHGDQDHNISPYRDYVIDAFNDNLSFDQFTREQLAGDLMPEATLDQRIASGYNRLLQTSHEGGVQAKEYLAIYAADRVRNLSGVWLGATMGCAQCHDHKYDPITSRDFYAMQAFFADVDEARHLKNGTNELPTRREPEIEVLGRRDRMIVAVINRELEAIGPSEVNRGEVDRLREIRDRFSSRTRKVMVTRSIEPRVIRFLPRGNWLDESGAIMEPAVPAFLGSVVTGTQRRLNRMDLANWLTDAERGNGLLTARVFVNRFWFLLFGEGLSRSLDDFGGQGEAPLHGDLLDQLAIEFVDSGWDLKHMFRLIVSSRTYQQDSKESADMRARDPFNRFLTRQARYRLPAEAVRDTLLGIAGLLDLEMGGASVKPFQPPGYYRHLNFPKREYQMHGDGRQWRRSLYVHWQRQFLHPMLAAFDAPSREECTAKRAVSNTPIAALVLLNDPSFVEAGKALSRRARREGGETVESKLAYAFALALSRQPDETEIRILRGVLGDEASPAEESESGWDLVARAILNLSEAITRQ